MANFTPAFAKGGEKRYPTADERNNGFGCGPADRELFNGQFNRLESEIGHVIDQAGIVQTDERMTQLYEAIQQLINAATGGGNPDQFILMDQARARLPIYPEILNSDGKIKLQAGEPGLVKITENFTISHRGIFQALIEAQTLTTTASKTYHLRWNKNDGLSLKDLSDLTYNPTRVAETNTAFDSTYDDALLARIITNSNNIPTLTPLVNLHVLKTSGEVQDPRGAYKGSLNDTAGYENNTMPSAIKNYDILDLNWSRRPESYLSALNDVWSYGSGAEKEFSAGIKTLSRYQLGVWGQGDKDIRIAWGAIV